MSNQFFDELDVWDKKICKIAKSWGLDWHPIEYEICDYFDMMGNMTYIGMPIHYQHWSFGRDFDRLQQMYDAGLEGLPYELIINANPSIAYLMRENEIPLQVLIMAHCVGHSDFFKNNVTFSKTMPDTVIERFKTSSKRIRKYIEDPSIGVARVEEVLDAARALKFQSNRYPNIRRLSHAEQEQKYRRLIQEDKRDQYKNFDINKFPLEPDNDILMFLAENSPRLADWERDIVGIVHDEGQYFIPQVRTKIANEGWASFIHYSILNELKLPPEYHMMFIQTHNQVIRPLMGKINPYHLGFNIFQRIHKKHGMEKCLAVRECYSDETFVQEFVDEELCYDLNLFSFSKKKVKQDHHIVTIDDVADEPGWKEVRNELVRNVGINSIPSINVVDVQPNGTLVLKHAHDGRDLELNYAQKMVGHVRRLWGDPILLETIVEDEVFTIDDDII